MMREHATHPALLRLCWLIPLLTMIFWLTSPSAVIRGQDSAETPSQAAITADEVNQVARELWCPLCSGVRLDSCELKACDQMKDVIEIKLSEGENLQSIKDYFVEQYGPQVLGEPPRSGFNLLAWILPVLVAVGGGVFLWMRARRMVQPVPQGAPADAPSPGEQEEYAQKLEEELSQYD